MKLSFLCLLMLAVPEVSPARTLLFNELGFGPLIDVNGLHTQGVLFGFSSGQAAYNGAIGTSGTAVLSVDPVLSGETSGMLAMLFDEPTTMLQFNIVLQSIFDIDDSDTGPNGGPAYSVWFSNGDTRTGGTTPQPGGLYSEGTFLYTGTAFDRANITFFTGSDAGGMPVTHFGIDNLTFAATEPQPEPGTMILLATGLLAVGAVRQRCHR